MVSGIFSIPLQANFSQTNSVDRTGGPRDAMLREYIGSDENRLVQYAAESLLERTSCPNPVVFYGPTGTGKSFLALGLAERWQQKYAADRVVVTCGADYARSYANAVDTNHLAVFRKKSRAVDLFVLDDAHHMQQKRAAQEELARAIDVMLRRNTAILITLCTSPNSDTTLQPGLRSRLLAGLAVPFTAPGASARILLLRQLAALHGVPFSDEALQLLANSTWENELRQWTVPQLNHAVIQLGLSDDSIRPQIDVEQVRQFLRDQQIEQQITLPTITHLVAKHFSLNGRELRGPSRKRHVVRARGVAMLLSWTLTGKSLDAVGRYFGNRDHTTVLHACRKTESIQKTDPLIDEAMKKLLDELKKL